MDVPLIDRKRDYLRRAVDALKAKGMTQRQIAERMEENEASLSGRLSGQRGIPDDYIDRFSAEFKFPFTVGVGVEGVSPELLEKFITQAEVNTRLLNLLVGEVEKLQREKA